jgi:glycosyltransferase involved in cell wall biosynthesis
MHNSTDYSPNKDNLISVIVPVYNTEKYLSNCLFSIINQSYQNIEIICINDGSTDSSLDICNKFKKLDNRFTIYTKQNGGVSSARNLGIEVSKGAYITFVDSDDTIDQHMVEHLYNKIVLFAADASTCGLIEYSEMGDKLSQSNNFNDTLLNNIKSLNFFSKYHRNGLCGKLLKKQLIDTPNIRFNESLNISEDLLFCCEYFLKSKKIIHTSNPFYYYFRRSSSAMLSRDKSNDLQRSLELEKEFFKLNKRIFKLSKLVTVSLINSIILKKIKSSIDYRNSPEIKILRKRLFCYLFSCKVKLKSKLLATFLCFFPKKSYIILKIKE